MNIYIPEWLLWLAGVFLLLIIIFLAWIGYKFLSTDWRIRW